MPAPRCETCNLRTHPNNRVTEPTLRDKNGHMIYPARSWHADCLTDELDALSEADD